MSKPSIHQIITRLLSDAASREKAAEEDIFNRGSDAGQVRAAVYYYQLGQCGELPKEWQPTAEKLEKEADPQYQQFLELQKRFTK